MTHPNTSFGGLSANHQMKHLTHMPGTQCSIKVSSCCHRQEAQINLSLNCGALYQASRSKTPKSVTCLPRATCPCERVLYYCSVAKLGPTLCDPMNCSTPGFSVLHHLFSLLKLTSMELLMPSNHLILCHPLLLLPSIFPSIRVFSTESVLHIRWLKYWSFIFSISPSNEYSRLVSFRMNWCDLAVQATLKSLVQHHSLKA